jgi:hypothetical protein
MSPRFTGWPIGESVTGERIWLDVPYSEKDEAKSHGARWDPATKRWYAPRPDMADLERWTAQPDVPDLLPGEDRRFGSGLFVDLVPTSCWFTIVRSCVAPRDWERLRRMVTRRAAHTCEICRRREDRDKQRWIEVHERWAYDPARRVQTLRRLICLCTDCHRVTHFGLANIKGLTEAAFTHLKAMTGWSTQQAREHVDAAFAEWQQRSQTVWTLNLDILTGAGITVTRPPDAHTRRQLAEDELRGR